eukprot:2185988-Pleurochrysis_carterae.AAC.2
MKTQLLSNSRKKSGERLICPRIGRTFSGPEEHASTPRISERGRAAAPRYDMNSMADCRTGGSKSKNWSCVGASILRAVTFSGCDSNFHFQRAGSNVRNLNFSGQPGTTCKMSGVAYRRMRAKLSAATPRISSACHFKYSKCSQMRTNAIDNTKQVLLILSLTGTPLRARAATSLTHAALRLIQQTTYSYIPVQLDKPEHVGYSKLVWRQFYLRISNAICDMDIVRHCDN